ncbi:MULTISPECIES: TetR/AcrR family transcriptional regulator [unclassified Streptomyces]|uniref:TetR/AcrR family transcriptional regulator n=1 Tax=unclassified Streptomyces TaxID=2593676 RepID=UPI0036ED32D5
MTEGRIPVERRRRKPTKTGVLLSGDLIVDCALRLVGQHGPDALSVRRLGAALGCDPSAVYRYFHNTDDLLLAVADRIIGESMDGFEPGDDWVANLRNMARRIHRAYSEHPRIAAMAAYRVTRRINEVRAVDTGIGLLLSAGFDDATAVRYYAAFVDTALGHAALDAAHLALPPERRAQDHSAWTDTYQSLPADSHPQLAAVREHLPIMALSSFETALELLLSALAAQAPR